MLSRHVSLRLAFSLIAALAVGFFTTTARAVAPPPRDARVRLDEFLAEYRRYGLPLPPKDARLVRYETTPPHLFNGKPRPAQYSLAFLTTEKSGPFLRRGIKCWEITKITPDNKRVEPTARSAREANGSVYDNLCFALQCHSLGWVDLAEELLAQAQEKHPQTLGLLRHYAWEYWEWEICEADRDWREVLPRLKALSAAVKELRTPDHLDIINSLEAALRPRKAKPGKAQALIGALVANPQKKNRGTISDELLELGFGAVPALIDHLDDERMTRCSRGGFMNNPARHDKIKDVVVYLLGEIAGDGLSDEISKPIAEKWWKEARALGQEKYALRHALNRDQGCFDPYQLEVLRKRYPRRLPGLYRKILDDHPDIDSSSLAEAIADSSLPLDEKLKLLRDGATRKNLKHRSGALDQLLELDRPYFLEVVRKTLRDLPRDVKGSYGDAEEARFARFIVLADEPDLWNELRTVARRSSVGLRMELLENVYDNNTPSGRIRQLRLLAAFLDDATVRDARSNPERFKDSYAGSQFPVLSVRNFVALKMATILGVDVPFVSTHRMVLTLGSDIPPAPAPTEAQWKEVRKAVRQAFEREDKNWAREHEGKEKKR